MTDINIYKNFNLSLADIHRVSVARNEVSVTGYTPPQQASFAKKFIVTFLVAFISFGIIAVVVIMMLQPFSPKNSNIRPETEMSQEKLLPSSGGEYVQLQIIEFAEGIADNSAAAKNITPETETLPSLAPQKTVPAPPVAPSPAQEVPKPPANAKKSSSGATAKPPAIAAAARYSLALAGGSSADLASLKSLASQNNITFTADKISSTATVWTVYTHTIGTGVYMEGMEVAPAASFRTVEEAVAFAENVAGSDEVTIIRMENKIQESYNISLCCMELDKAKLLVQQSGITDKVVQLQRQ